MSQGAVTVQGKDPLNQVNVHVLNAILDAGRERVVVASRDIYDERGIKLLARDSEITAALQQRLLERRLREPLEKSLRFESGLDKAQLRQAFAALLDSGHVLARVVRPWVKAMADQIGSLQLGPVVQCLMTTVQAATPRVFDHAVQAMTLAGAMAARAGGNPGDIRLAMLAGLVHDVGELYLDPRLQGVGEVLDIRQHRELAGHARIAELMLAGLTEYPLALSRAVGEHHERMDGSGYPAQRSADRLSTQGRMLAVVESTVGILARPGMSLARASFALRVVPGEYDGQWVGMVATAAAAAPEELEAPDRAAIDQARAGLAASSQRMERASAQAALLADNPRPAVYDVATRAVHLLERLRTGWNAIGLWAGEAAYAGSAREVLMADQELSYRLSLLERDCVWHREDLDPEDTRLLLPLWQALAA